MGNLKDSLSKSLNRLGIARQVEAAGVVEKATEEIGKYIPREDFEVISFRGGTLKVGLSFSSAANELRFYEEMVKKQIPDIKKVSLVNRHPEQN